MASCACHCQLKVPFVFLSRATHGPPKDCHSHGTCSSVCDLDFKNKSGDSLKQPNMKDPTSKMPFWPLQIISPNGWTLHKYNYDQWVISDVIWGGEFPLISTGLELFCFLGQVWSRFHCVVLQMEDTMKIDLRYNKCSLCIIHTNTVCWTFKHVASKSFHWTLDKDHSCS